jgi:hypothetical protein
MLYLCPICTDGLTPVRTIVAMALLIRGAYAMTSLLSESREQVVGRCVIFVVGHGVEPSVGSAAAPEPGDRSDSPGVETSLVAVGGNTETHNGHAAETQLLVVIGRLDGARAACLLK